MHTLYANILAEVAKLRRTGGIERRGRMPTDPAARRFANQTRAFLQALQGTRPRDPDAPRNGGMSIEFQGEWDREIERINNDVVGSWRDEHARESAYTRRKVVGADSQLLNQAKANSKARKARIDLVKLAEAHVLANGKKVKSKTIARALEELKLPELKQDSVRKLLSEIRRGRAA